MRVRVRVEVPRFGFVKRGAGRVEYVSPIPCPFNYGCVPGELAPDGDEVDAIVLGPRLRAGEEVEREVVARVRFVDDGVPDDKLVCGPMRRGDRVALVVFFRAYAPVRSLLNRLKGRRGRTAFLGLA